MDGYHNLNVSVRTRINPPLLIIPIPLRKMPFCSRPTYPNHREREAMILSSYAGILMVRKRTLFTYMGILHLPNAFLYECIFILFSNHCF